MEAKCFCLLLSSYLLSDMSCMITGLTNAFGVLGHYNEWPASIKGHDTIIPLLKLPILHWLSGRDYY